MAKLPKLFLTAAAVAMMVPATAMAAPDTFMVRASSTTEDQANTRIRNGVEVLQATNEEYTNEMSAIALAADGLSGVIVEMGTGPLANGNDVEVGRMQGACLPFTLALDPNTNTGIIATPDIANAKYITQRQAEDYRAFNHPEIDIIQAAPGAPQYYAVRANWDRNNNTNTDRYLQVVDGACNLMTLNSDGSAENVNLRENNTSANIMNKNNDNCAGHQSGGGTSTIAAIETPGCTGFAEYSLCNGSGNDDGWANYFEVCAPDAAGVVAINKVFDTSIEPQEERSRGMSSVIQTLAGELIIVSTHTSGNNQPQREGIYATGVALTGPNQGDRLWRERIAYRGETAEGQRTYAMRVKSVAMKNLDGSLTNEVCIQYQMHRGNNNNNQKGGYDDAVMMTCATPDAQGLNAGTYVDITQQTIDAFTELTHATMFQTFQGEVGGELKPTLSFLSPNHNSSSVEARVMNLNVAGEGIFTLDGAFQLGSPVDSQKYSKYLGNNPNNQGRNFPDCNVIANPFIDAPGKTNGVPQYNMCVFNGKLTNVGNPAVKPDTYIELWASVGPTAPTPDPGTTPGGDEPGDDDDDDDTTPGGGDNGNTTGGCSASNSSSGGTAALLLLAFAFIGIRRRK